MQPIEVIIHLKSKSQYRETFMSEIELDQYHEDNESIIERIEILNDNKEKE